MKTLNDAIDALDRIEAVHKLDDSFNFAVIYEFLRGLQAKEEPAAIADDAEGFILEHAATLGFDYIDDDAELLVVSARKLIDFVKIRQCQGSKRELHVLTAGGNMFEASKYINKIGLAEFVVSMVYVSSNYTNVILCVPRELLEDLKAQGVLQ